MISWEIVVCGGCCCVWVWSSEMLRAIHPVSGRRDRELSSFGGIGI